jgi:hypothetical protein
MAATRRGDAGRGDQKGRVAPRNAFNTVSTLLARRESPVTLHRIRRSANDKKCNRNMIDKIKTTAVGRRRSKLYPSPEDVKASRLERPV